MGTGHKNDGTKNTFDREVQPHGWNLDTKISRST